LGKGRDLWGCRKLCSWVLYFIVVQFIVIVISMSLISDRVEIVVNFVEFHVVKHSENIIMMVSQLRVITIVRKAICLLSMRGKS
jgi:hypothetical protein